MGGVQRMFITLTLIIVTGHVVANASGDPNPLQGVQNESNQKFQQLHVYERLIAIEEQSQSQQQQIAELEARDLDKDNVIYFLKTTSRNQQQQIDELNRSLVETNQALLTLQDVLAEHNGAINETEINEPNEATVLRRQVTKRDENRIRAQRQEPEVDHVAFTVILTRSIDNMIVNQNVVFDKVETNIGNAYNQQYGVFTAHVAGTYVFHVTILAYNGAEGRCKIAVNGANKADVYAKGGSGTSDQGSQTLITRLNQGDIVVIQNDVAHGSVFGDVNNWTTFSGFLLRSDAQGNTIVG